MKIMKTWLATHGAGGAHQIMDTIEYEGSLWLVPEWLESTSKGWTTPIRIIRPLKLSFQKMKMNGADFLLSHSVPTTLFLGHVPLGQEDEFEIIDHPPINIGAELV